MSPHRIFATSVAAVYPLYLAKVERKGRRKEELDAALRWLTGYSDAALGRHLARGTTFEGFFAAARLPPEAATITGVVCGVRVESVADPLMQKIRYLDKLVDELAKGWPLAKVLRAEADAPLPRAAVRAGASRRAAGVTVDAYTRGLPPGPAAVASLLRAEIERALPAATSKVWHGHPVWFDGANPIVGYHARGAKVTLLFWNGRALEVPGLRPVGRHRAAEVSFTTTAEVDRARLRRWLTKARVNVLDSAGYFRALREQAKPARPARRARG